jgi:hypothetical protein
MELVYCQPGLLLIKLVCLLHSVPFWVIEELGVLSWYLTDSPNFFQYILLLSGNYVTSPDMLPLLKEFTIHLALGCDNLWHLCDIVRPL